jgi:hypothetical protein
MRPISFPDTIGGPCPLASVSSFRVESSQMGVVPLAILLGQWQQAAIPSSVSMPFMAQTSGTTDFRVIVSYTTKARETLTSK